MKQVELVRPKTYASQYGDFSLGLNVSNLSLNKIEKMFFRDLQIDSGILAKWDSNGPYFRVKDGHRKDQYLNLHYDFDFYDMRTGLLNPLYLFPYSGNGISGRVDIYGEINQRQYGLKVEKLCTYVFACPLNDSYNVSEVDDLNDEFYIEFEQGRTFGYKIGQVQLKIGFRS